MAARLLMCVRAHIAVRTGAVVACCGARTSVSSVSLVKTRLLSARWFSRQPLLPVFERLIPAGSRIRTLCRSSAPGGASPSVEEAANGCCAACCDWRSEWRSRRTEPVTSLTDARLARRSAKAAFFASCSAVGGLAKGSEERCSSSSREPPLLHQRKPMSF